MFTNSNAKPSREHSLRARIELRVMRLLADLFQRPADEIPLQAGFDELGADSVDLTELQIMLLEEFGLEVPEQAAGTIRVPQDLIDFISAHLPASESA